MERVDLQAKERTVLGKKVKRLRADGWIPGVVFGPDNPSRSIKMEERELVKTMQDAGSTTLINLYVGDGSEPKLVLAREVQSDILTGRLLHVDFYEVRLTETVRTTPRLDFFGEAPVLESGEAVVIYGMNEVEVECLPTDLISSIEVDVSVLETLDDSILVSDLSVPEGAVTCPCRKV
jgi:large subunit ribosomal protein L25